MAELFKKGQIYLMLGKIIVINFLKECSQDTEPTEPWINPFYVNIYYFLV